MTYTVNITLNSGEVYTLESSDKLALTNKLYEFTESFYKEIENISKMAVQKS